jgi:beta-phosphoglucomutase-like phosphatase (HAD superfamily)
MSKYKAILYDLDGVLVDACEWHYISFNRALKETIGYEISYHEHISTFNGLPTLTKLNILKNNGIISDLKVFDVIFEKKQKYTIETINLNGTLDVEKIKLHEYTKKHGLESVCVTNSIRETAELMLKKTGQIDYFKFLVCNQDVKKNKPDPCPYQFAVNKLNLPMELCLAVEDSPKGISSAKSCGLNVLEVNNPTDVNIDLIKRAIYV